MSGIKLLFIRSSNPFVESSASANRYSGLLKYLAVKGVNITVLVTAEYQNLSEFHNHKNHKLSNIQFKYLAYSVKSNIWLRRINKYFLGPILNPITTLLIRHHLKKKYDFIRLTFNYEILQTFNKLKTPIRAKTIIELNEYNDLHLYDNSITAIQKKRAEKESQALIKALQKIDIVLPMTETLLKHYQALANPKALFMHLPMTVDPSRFDDNSVDICNIKQPYIAYAGALNNQKDGIDILIKAFAKISPQYPQFHLVLAGFYHYDVVEQKKLIDQLNLNDRIHYLYNQSNDQVISILKNANLLALARPESYQASGGFPTKLGEYLMTSNPVCVTAVGEIPRYLEDNYSAFLAKPGNVSSFAEAMDRALSNPSLAKVVGINGKNVALEHFNVHKQSELLFLFLSEIIKSTNK